MVKTLIRKRKIKNLGLTLALLIFCLALILSGAKLSVYAENPSKAKSSETAKDYETIQRIYDEADLLSSEEEVYLENYLDKFSKANQQDLIFVSSADMQGKATRDFAADFYDEKFPQNDASGAIILLDMENRELNIVTTGSMIDIFTDYDEERLYDAGWDSLLEGNYAGMVEDIVQEMSYLMDRGVVAGHQRMSEEEAYLAGKEEKRENTLSPVEIAASGLVSLIGGGSFYGITKSKYKPQTRKPNYNVSANSLVAMAAPLDKLINQQIRYIPVESSNQQNQSSSYNSRTTTTTFTGSSGKTHGGGSGRKF